MQIHLPPSAWPSYQPPSQAVGQCCVLLLCICLARWVATHITHQHISQTSYQAPRTLSSSGAVSTSSASPWRAWPGLWAGTPPTSSGNTVSMTLPITQAYFDITVLTDYLSPLAIRRLHAALGSPLMAMSCLSNFYFFSGLEVIP